jgi:nitric oxide dioxygenase
VRAIVGDLLNLGVSRDRIHYEFFGPTDEALAA